LVERTITLENVTLIDFLGVENKNIKEVASAFPKSKIISRGNEIKIKGNSTEILKINEILNSLLNHYHKYGKITPSNVQKYLAEEPRTDHFENSNEDVLVYGPSGIIVNPKTLNQQKMVYMVGEKDVVFALGPAGTGKTYISVAMAVRALKNKEVKKIIITRPAVNVLWFLTVMVCWK